MKSRSVRTLLNVLIPKNQCPFPIQAAALHLVHLPVMNISPDMIASVYRSPSSQDKDTFRDRDRDRENGRDRATGSEKDKNTINGSDSRSPFSSSPSAPSTPLHSHSPTEVKAICAWDDAEEVPSGPEGEKKDVTVTTTATAIVIPLSTSPTPTTVKRTEGAGEENIISTTFSSSLSASTCTQIASSSDRGQGEGQGLADKDKDKVPSVLPPSEGVSPTLGSLPDIQWRLLAEGRRIYTADFTDRYGLI